MTTDAADKTKDWLASKDTWTELQTMDLHSIKILVIPTEDEDMVISIYILKVIDGWIYWSDETNINVFVPMETLLTR
jgi:hypothetical protein